jgi:urease accessory protein
VNTAAATARLHVDVVAGQSAATAVRASSPLKLLVPRPRGAGVWAYLGSLGGGLVAGDETSLDVRLGPNARCFLTTQASTKIYRNPRSRPCGHSLRADLAAGSLLVLAPEPIQSFADSAYTQRQEFHLHPEAGLVMLDWFCSGRAARRERWNFSRLQSRNEIFVGEERLLVDSLLLDQTDGPLEGEHRMGRFNCLAVIVITGAALAAGAARWREEIESRPVVRRAGLIISASPIREGAIVRLAGERGEEVAREIHRGLAFVAEWLGDDPWSRKW